MLQRYGLNVNGKWTRFRNNKIFQNNVMGIKIGTWNVGFQQGHPHIVDHYAWRCSICDECHPYVAQSYIVLMHQESWQQQ